MSTFSPETLRTWQHASCELGFTLTTPYELRDSTGAAVVYAAFLPQFGSSHGILVIIDADYSEAMHLAQQQGFGFSILSDDPICDRDSFVDMLCDWGWNSQQSPPVWYAEPNNANDECA